jgi:hypothetical protein
LEHVAKGRRRDADTPYFELDIHAIPGILA